MSSSQPTNFVSSTEFTPPDLPKGSPFPDRRASSSSNSQDKAGGERRQFGNSYQNLSPAGQELAQAIDRYKMEYRRRYITTDELLTVLKELGYEK